MHIQAPLRQRIDDGGIALGARAMTVSPAIIEVYGQIGLDFVWLDFEHGGPNPINSNAVEALVRAAATGGVDLLVRLPSGDPPMIRKVLDAGVRSILIPRVETSDDVFQAVAAARFDHSGDVGDRGIAASRASGWGRDINEFVEREDREVMVGVMIENVTAVENIRDICSIPNLGFTFIGPADLSVSAGHPMNKDHPDVRSAIRRIHEACQEGGVPVGRIATDADDATTALFEGYQLLRIGGEVEAVRKLLTNRLNSIEKPTQTECGTD